mmetsp:Transcript_3556/g.5368  ORF Transcript_3556/g.5368 Transcript_3556/m.5368 type:complete len:681 (-) Transcript_3556:438-2480(-)
MKFSTRTPEVIWSLLLLPSLASAKYNSIRTLVPTTDDIVNFGVDGALTDGVSCLGAEDFFAAFEGDCNFEDLSAAIATKLPASCDHTAAEELEILLGSEAKLRGLCESAWDAHVATHRYPFASVSGFGTEWDKEYYDGNTNWNEEIETLYDTIVDERANHLRTDANRVLDLYKAEAERDPIEFPSYISNFDSCDLRTVMCCWSADRQANDNNGNCATPYDTKCKDSDPGDNTDLCAVDMARTTSSSSHVDDGFAIFEGNSEGPIHCHGFAWGQDSFEDAARYKGNNLFYVSMYDHMHQRGYVRNVPGAPMCGCLEKMPIVSRSDCTEIAETASWTFQWSAEQNEFTARLDEVEVAFNACQGLNNNNNNLEAYYRRLVEEGRATQAEFETFQNTIVGSNNCGSAMNELLNEKGYVYDPEPTLEGWTQAYGKGSLIPVEHQLLRPGTHFTKQGGDDPARHLNSNISPVFYAKRWCASCVASHREIIYKRLTAIPEDFDFYDLFTENWVNSPANVNLLDFTLHSSMEDALADKNPWSFCNYNDPGIGFPRDCGPTNSVTGQWNSLNRGGQRNVAFYLWNENPSITDEARPSPDPTVEFKAVEPGFCVNNGADQNSGFYKIAEGDFETAEKQLECATWCAAYSGHTGCEAIWNQRNRGCYVHTEPVTNGNGVANHACWVNAETA